MPARRFLSSREKCPRRRVTSGRLDGLCKRHKKGALTVVVGEAGPPFTYTHKLKQKVLDGRIIPVHQSLVIKTEGQFEDFGASRRPFGLPISTTR